MDYIVRFAMDLQCTLHCTAGTLHFGLGGDLAHLVFSSITCIESQIIPFSAKIFGFLPSYNLPDGLVLCVQATLIIMLWQISG